MAPHKGFARQELQKNVHRELSFFFSNIFVMDIKKRSQETKNQVETRSRDMKVVDLAFLEFWKNNTNDAQRFSFVHRLKSIPTEYKATLETLRINVKGFASILDGVGQTLLESRQGADHYLDVLYQDSYQINYRKMHPSLASELVNSIEKCQMGGALLWEKIKTMRAKKGPNKKAEEELISKHMMGCPECMEMESVMVRANHISKQFIEYFPFFVQQLFSSVFLDYICGRADCPDNKGRELLDGEQIKAMVRPLRYCGQCGVIRYCNQKCAKLNWRFHQAYCIAAPSEFHIPISLPSPSPPSSSCSSSSASSVDAIVPNKMEPEPEPLMVDLTQEQGASARARLSFHEHTQSSPPDPKTKTPKAKKKGKKRKAVYSKTNTS
jgi:hypothetical protein